MSAPPRVLGVIPARYASSRFPGKALAALHGKPMVQHVVERARQARLLDEVLVATDDRRILDAVLAFGGKACMTSPAHPSGTDRIAEVIRDVPCDLVVNIQGDEPLIDPEVIDRAVEPLARDPAIPMGTLARPMDPAEAADPSKVKVVLDREDFALYFSRSPIPYLRDGVAAPGARPYWLHIGLYVYRREALLRLAGLAPTPLEQRERLEQLRALEHGLRIKVVRTEHESFGVDTPADLERMRKLME
ncbi:MAG TPA: 3-deoxy-manno-octulosonate cytidylyltransferase [Candidatus Sulfotelmatobacter sp.]|nr:3-deoxy-manno-octulosonate cytidylyltransferase [Candidatus Sulfotelmatobacter sp.]